MEVFLVHLLPQRDMPLLLSKIVETYLVVGQSVGVSFDSRLAVSYGAEILMGT